MRSIKYIGNGQVRVEVDRKTRALLKIKPGQLVQEGEIPQDAFEALAKRNDFEAQGFEIPAPVLEE
jgi:hypothetical protein